MARLGSITLTGKSGNQYKFSAYNLGTVFKRDLGAVYMVTRRRQVGLSGGFKHKAVYMGATGDIRIPLGDEAASLAVAGANCICVHSERNEAARADIQQDLLRE